MNILCKLFGWYCATQTPAPITKAPVSEIKPVQPPTTIEQIVLANGCKDHYFKERGKAPMGFMMGIAHTYAQAKCKKDFVTRVTVPHKDYKDVMKHYNLAPKLENVFTLLVGLGMRESSGRHCCGRDMSAGFSTSQSAEAGLWQTSYDSRYLDKSLPSFADNWTGECHLEYYSKGVTCSAADWKYWGDQMPGRLYQEKAKKCPSFHGEYTALVMRANKNHFGPFYGSRKVAEFVPACLALFEKLNTVIQCN